MFFLGVPICKSGTVTCEIGVLQVTCHTLISALESLFRFQSFDLVSARHARSLQRKGKSMINDQTLRGC